METTRGLICLETRSVILSAEVSVNEFERFAGSEDNGWSWDGAMVRDGIMEPARSGERTGENSVCKLFRRGGCCGVADGGIELDDED